MKDKSTTPSEENKSDVAIDKATSEGNKHWEWSTKKPKFKEECLLMVADYIGRTDRDYENRQYEYTLYEIKLLEGCDENDHAAFYWGILCTDGEEWGDLDELEASLYMTMPLLNGSVKEVMDNQNKSK